MLSKSEKILMSVNSKQKLLCQLATTELSKQQENDRTAFGSDALQGLG